MNILEPFKFDVICFCWLLAMDKILLNVSLFSFRIFLEIWQLKVRQIYVWIKWMKDKTSNLLIACNDKGYEQFLAKLCICFEKINFQFFPAYAVVKWNSLYTIFHCFYNFSKRKHLAEILAQDYFHVLRCHLVSTITYWICFDKFGSIRGWTFL